LLCLSKTLPITKVKPTKKHARGKSLDDYFADREEKTRRHFLQRQETVYEGGEAASPRWRLGATDNWKKTASKKGNQ